MSSLPTPSFKSITAPIAAKPTDLLAGAGGRKADRKPFERISGASGRLSRIRELLIRQRTQGINALRGHLGEFRQIVPQGAGNASKLIAIVEDPESGLLRLIGLDCVVPDFSTLSHRQKTLKVNMPYRSSNSPLHLLVDSTGVRLQV